MTQPSLVNVEVGGGIYPWRSEGRCLCCSHPMRVEIETMLAQGRTYRGIIKALELEGAITERNVRDHVRNEHLPTKAPAVRAVAQAQAVGLSEALAPLAQGVAAHLSFAHSLLERVRRRLEAGEDEPSIRDGLAAARLIQEIEGGATTSRDAEWEALFITLHDAVQSELDFDQRQAIGRVMRDHPLAKEMFSRGK